MSQIVTYSHRYKRPPRKKLPQAPHDGPAVLKVTPKKEDRWRRYERALSAKKADDPEVGAFLARMLRPLDEDS
jgi:hypothetical protein